MNREFKLEAEDLYFGEGPRWHDNKLWFSDFYHKAVMTLDESGSIEKIVKLVRMSIYLFLRLASNYSGGGKIEKICDDIDKALINKKNQRFFKSKLK